ncbi:MAG: NBR1-Ig-like domain-containing protein [Brevefilum sp.]
MIKKRKLLTVMVGLLVFSVLLSSCQAFGLGDQEPDEDVLETAAAQTLAALQTQTAEVEPTDTPEPTPTTAPTDTPTPTPTTEETEPSDNAEAFELYNFAENVCQAGWESSVVEDIQCPSDENFDQGFVQPVQSPALEDGNTYNEPAMLTYPDSGKSGYMVGRYPDLRIEDGDHFRAIIGCQADAESCDVRYTLRVAIPGEGFDNLGSWREINEGQVYPIDVDLSAYAGMEVGIVLSAIAADDTGENYALWVNPRVVRNAGRVEDPETGGICNWGRFVDDVTIEDRTVLDANESFTKTWRLENIGDCTWTTGYEVFFNAGNQMSAPAIVNMPETVAPGETVDISIDMVAPDSPGTYTGYWLLRDEEGDIFGLGSDTDSPFWVRIRVTEEDEVVIYNFADNVCEAGWESEVEENIPCPSTEDFDQGFVQSLDSAELENGNTYVEPTILSYPNDGEGGYMVGRFPDLVIEKGDRFLATIGCQLGAEACDVRYTLRIVRTGEGFDRLGMWHEVYEGLIHPIDVDLSDYAGQEVEIVLSTIAADDTGENYALWLNPRVVRETD